MPEPTQREADLSEQLARATAEIARGNQERGQLRTENKLLREKLDVLIQRLFGAQSEPSAAR